MSQNTSSSSPSPTTTSHTAPSSQIEADIALLRSFVSQDVPDDSADANVAELLEELESADGIAQGLETRMDDILQNLDALIQSFEQNRVSEEIPETEQVTAAVGALSDSHDQSDHLETEETEGGT